MDPIVITILVVVVVVFCVAIRMDLKRRRLHDTKSAGDMAKGARQVRQEGKGKAGESNIGL